MLTGQTYRRSTKPAGWMKYMGEAQTILKKCLGLQKDLYERAFEYHQVAYEEEKEYTLKRMNRLGIMFLVGVEKVRYFVQDERRAEQSRPIDSVSEEERGLHFYMSTKVIKPDLSTIRAIESLAAPESRYLRPDLRSEEEDVDVEMIDATDCPANSESPGPPVRNRNVLPVMDDRPQSQKKPQGRLTKWSSGGGGVKQCSCQEEWSKEMRWGCGRTATFCHRSAKDIHEFVSALGGEAEEGGNGIQRRTEYHRSGTCESFCYLKPPC